MLFLKASRRTRAQQHGPSTQRADPGWIQRVGAAILQIWTLRTPPVSPRHDGKRLFPQQLSSPFSFIQKCNRQEGSPSASPIPLHHRVLMCLPGTRCPLLMPFRALVNIVTVLPIRFNSVLKVQSAGSSVRLPRH